MPLQSCWNIFTFNQVSYKLSMKISFKFDKSSLASGGFTPDQGLCPWTRYMLVLAICPLLKLIRQCIECHTLCYSVRGNRNTRSAFRTCKICVLNTSHRIFLMNRRRNGCHCVRTNYRLLPIQLLCVFCNIHV